MHHLFGNILTHYGIAANNRGETEGNISTLQKIFWQDDVHTTVSSEAIRWALRYYWQQQQLPVNRCWNESTNDYRFTNPDFDPVQFVDDDVLGFMRAEGGKIETSESLADENNSTTSHQSAKKPQKRKPRPKGSAVKRRGALEVSRAISMHPFSDDVTFNASSGKKNRTSLYGTEAHATQYQYGFAVTPNHLHQKNRILSVLDGLLSIFRVGGNHGRFLYDFSPDTLVLRWTHDFSPRLLYCFNADESGTISVASLIRKLDAGDIDPQEIWVGGSLSPLFEGKGANVFAGTKEAVEALKKLVVKDLKIK